MGIVNDPNAKKRRKNPFALNGTKIRPIERELFSDERDAAALFAMDQKGKLLKGPEEGSRRRFGSLSAGSQVGGANLNGGVSEPGGSGPGHNPGNIGTT